MPRERSALWRFLALLCAAMLILAACGDDSEEGDEGGEGGGGEKKTVAIAFVGPLTGDNANLGINIRNGMRVAVEEANEESDKFEFEIKEFDTQGDPAQAPAQAAKYVADDSILGIVGPTFSGETKAVLPTLQEAKLVMVSASATAVDIPTVVAGQTVFHRVIPDDGVQGEGLAEYITKKLEAKTAAYVDDNSDYGKGLADGTRQILEKAGVRTVVTDHIDPKATDYSSAVTKVKQANADILFYGGYYNEAGRFKKQLTDNGVKSLFVSGDGALDPGFIESAGSAGGEGAQITCPCRLASEDAGGDLAAFAKKYEEVNNTEPGTYSSEGYDAANILINGIEDGNDTREKLLAYVEGLEPYKGISKTIEFEENGNVKAGDVFVYEVKSGKLEELGTMEELVG